jgi:uncharacterized protein
LRGHYDSLGRRDSLWEGFYPNGQVATRQWFSADLWQDSSWAWDSSGHVRERGYFALGTGTLNRLDTLGQPVEIRPYQNGKREGQQKGFYANGSLKNLSRYHGDSIIATESYHPNGKAALQGDYLEGKRQGLWSRWNEKGVLIETSHYQAGVLTGEQKFYDAKGQLTQSLRYEHGYPAEGRFRGIPGVKPIKRIYTPETIQTPE